MDTFKGQDNDIVLSLCKKHFCQVVIVPHNLTNKFQPLDITVNKPAKSFISNKYNEWFAEQVAKQLQKGIPPADIQVSLNLGELKVMHARWISALYDYLCDQKEIILNGLKAAGITEAVESASACSKGSKIHLQNKKNTFERTLFYILLCFRYLLLKKKCLYCVFLLRLVQKLLPFLKI